MNTDQIIIGFLATLLGLMAWLVKYSIMQRDKHSDKISESLLSIKEDMSFMKSEVSSLKKDIENNTKQTQSIDSKVQGLVEQLYAVRLNEASFLEWRKGIDRQLEDIYTKIGIKK